MLACSRKKRKSAALISLPFWVPPPTPLFTGEIKFKKFFFPFRSPSNNFWLCVYGLNCVYSLISFQQQILLPRLQFFSAIKYTGGKAGRRKLQLGSPLGLISLGLDGKRVMATLYRAWQWLANSAQATLIVKTIISSYIIRLWTTRFWKIHYNEILYIRKIILTKGLGSHNT